MMEITQNRCGDTGQGSETQLLSWPCHWLCGLEEAIGPHRASCGLCLKEVGGLKRLQVHFHLYRLPGCILLPVALPLRID